MSSGMLGLAMALLSGVSSAQTTPIRIGLAPAIKPDVVLPIYEHTDCTVQVMDAEGHALQAVVPLEVDITDPEGRAAEPSGHYGAVDGKLRLSLDIAPNDPVGTWQIRVRELASGIQKLHYFRVLAPGVRPPSRKPPSNGALKAVQPDGQ